MEAHLTWIKLDKIMNTNYIILYNSIDQDLGGFHNWLSG